MLSPSLLQVPSMIADAFSPPRRRFLQRAVHTLAGLALGPSLLALSQPLRAATLAGVGPLRPPDALGICLPAGFTARIVARAGEPLAGAAADSYRWHRAPDGGATFATPDGGWVYVSNSEVMDTGGVGALRFAADGRLQRMYPILAGTSRNCAGGATPWGSWLSCEERAQGGIFECDPLGQRPAVRRRALGSFKHEAVAVDPASGMLYLTEDEPDGCLYRYVPAARDAQGRTDLQRGQLQVAQLLESGHIQWLDLTQPNPGPADIQTRHQLKAATRFNGGEGIWYSAGAIYFTTKGDNRVWEYTPASGALRVIYALAESKTPILSGVDNITASASGDLLVAEDGGHMQLVIIDRHGQLAPLLRLTGQDSSEIAGPAFSPDGSRLYFSSQRGGAEGGGLTYEVSGPFGRFVG